MRTIIAIVAVMLLLAVAVSASVNSSEMPFVNAYLYAYGPWDFSFSGWPEVSFIDGFVGQYVWQDGAAHTLSGSIRDLELSVDYSLVEIGFGWLNNSGGYLVIDRDEAGYLAYLEYEAEVPVGWEVRLDSSGDYRYEITANADGSFVARVRDGNGWHTMTGPVSHTIPTVDRVFAVALTDGGIATAKINVDGAVYTITDSTDSAGGSSGLLGMAELSDSPPDGAELTGVQDIGGDPGASFSVAFNGVGAPALKQISIGRSRDLPGGLPTSQVSGYDTYSLTLRNDDPAKHIRANLFAKTGHTEAPYDMTGLLTEGPSMWIAPGSTATLSLDLRSIGLTDDLNAVNDNYGGRDRRKWLSAIGFTLAANVVESGASDAYHINAGESLAVSVVPPHDSLSLLVAGDSRFVRPGESPRVYLGQSGLVSPVVGYQAFLGFDSLLSISEGEIGMSLQPYPVHLYNELSGQVISLAAGIDNPGLQNPVTSDALLGNMLFTAGQTDGAAAVGFADQDPSTRFSDDQGDPIGATLACSPFIVVDGTPPAVSVVSPNGGEYIKGGSTYTIRWTATDAYLDPNSIKIEYFLGSPPDSPWYTASANQVNTGSFIWFPVPTINYSGTLVRVTATDRAGNITTDVSDTTFTIDSMRPQANGISASQGGGPDLTPSGTAVQGVVNIAVVTYDNLSGVAGPPVVRVTPQGGSPVTAIYVNESPTGAYNYTWTVSPTTPNGTAGISVTGLYDRAGNAAYTANDTFVVNKTQALVNLELEKVSVPSVPRWIKFVLGSSSGGVTPVTVQQQVLFTNGFGTTALTDLPNAVIFSQISAKDEQHTLRRTVPLSSSGNGQYTASFTGTACLTGGDLNNDNSVSIVDFGVFTTQYGTGPALSTQWPVRNANISCDGLIDTNDFTYIQIHFSANSDPAPGGALPLSGTPLSSVSVVELAEVIGLTAAQAADLDGDGMVDAKDVGLFARKLITVKGER